MRFLGRLWKWLCGLEVDQVPVRSAENQAKIDRATSIANRRAHEQARTLPDELEG